jgi:DNA-binding SARP family transcriptional activator
MLEYKRFRPLDPWIDALQADLRDEHRFASADAELRVRSALLAALSFRKPGDPMLDECAERMFELVENSTDPTLRTLSAAYLTYCARTGPVRVALRAQPLLQRLIRQPGLSSLTVAWGWWAIAYVHLMSRNADACRQAVAEADRIGRDESLQPVSRFAAAIGAHIEMDNGDLAAARAWADRLDEVVVPELAYDRALSNTIRAHLAVLDGDPAKASVLAQEAVELFDEAGVHQLRCLTRMQLAWPLMMQGELDAAEQAAQEALQLALAARAEWVEAEVRFVLAAIALERKDERAARTRLAAAFAMLDYTRYTPTLSKFRWCAAKLCAEALERGIAAGNARSLVRQLDLRPPRPDLEHWPWPIRVFALGPFRVEVNGAPLTFSRKTPRKPISLLKALVAFGGHDVPIEKLIDALWPELDGDSARDACWLALNRLRKLLGAPNAVPLAGGRLSLDRELVWTDVARFDRSPVPGPREAPADVQRALALYRGPFLSDEQDAAWAAPTREALRMKFIRSLDRHGRAAEACGRLDEAVALYLRGLELEPLAESFCQGLMRCYRQLGRSEDAIGVYERFRTSLLATSGRRPSAATEALLAGAGAGR